LATGVALGIGGWTVVLIAGSWATIWIVLTPWRRVDGFIPSDRARETDAHRQERNTALPDWARPGRTDEEDD
jgi:hypothetical protein